jgi:WD40 repeat protein
LLISTSEDGHFKIWDLRKPTTEFVMAYKDSEDSLCIGQFNPINPNIFAVAGDQQGQIAIWDMRMPKDSIHGFYHHNKQVTLLEWCPENEHLLASGSDDQKVYIWD